MPKVISALTARTQFGQIMKRAKQNSERFLVERRGQPQVLIMSLKDYVDTIAPAPQWLRAVQSASKRRGTNRLTMQQISAEVSAVRKARPKSKLSTR